MQNTKKFYELIISLQLKKTFMSILYINKK